MPVPVLIRSRQVTYQSGDVGQELWFVGALSKVADELPPLVLDHGTNQDHPGWTTFYLVVRLRGTYLSMIIRSTDDGKEFYTPEFLKDLDLYEFVAWSGSKGESILEARHLQTISEVLRS